MLNLYRKRCDSCTHEAEYMPTPEPVDGRCWDWHPELVWHEKVKPCEHGNCARHIIEESIGWRVDSSDIDYLWCDGKPKEDN